MDALELLRIDHERVKSLFHQVRNSINKQIKRQLFNSVSDELERHSMIEETVFYPAFRHYPDFKDIVDRSLADHDEVKAILRDLTELRDDAQFDSKFNELVQNVEKHIHTEENDFFAMVRKVMRRAEREQLGRHMQAARQGFGGTKAA